MRSEPPTRRAAERAVVGCLLVGIGVAVAWPSVLGGVAPWAEVLSPEDRSGSTIRQGNVTVPAAFESLHRRGVTGSDVDIGVLDVTGFDVGHPALTGRVNASRGFGGAAVDVGAAPRHGTAVATALGRLAPDASLHLAVARDADGVVAAAEWLGTRDVDVVVAPFNSLGAADDGTARVSRALSRLRDEGVVVVAAAGNFGRSHWAGRLVPTDDGRHRFGTAGTRNRVYPAPWTAGHPVTADLWLTWNGSRFPRDLNLHLYRLGRDGPERVATSTRVSGDGPRREYLRATLPLGRYYLAVGVPERSRPVTDGVAPRIEVTASGLTLDVTTPNGSVAAPATAPGVVGVGVTDPHGEVYPRSSRGPTTDGRRGVDVVAPATPFENLTAVGAAGTSAAATYAGATAALVADSYADAPPAAIERRLLRTATGGSEPNATAGYGRVSPPDAVLRDRADDPRAAAAGDGPATAVDARPVSERRPAATSRGLWVSRPVTNVGLANRRGAVYE
jgi:hypothetical protein